MLGLAEKMQTDDDESGWGFAERTSVEEEVLVSEEDAKEFDRVRLTFLHSLRLETGLEKISSFSLNRLGEDISISMCDVNKRMREGWCKRCSVLESVPSDVRPMTANERYMTRYAENGYSDYRSPTTVGCGCDAPHSDRHSLLQRDISTVGQYLWHVIHQIGAPARKHFACLDEGSFFETIPDPPNDFRTCPVADSVLNTPALTRTIVSFLPFKEWQRFRVVCNVEFPGHVWFSEIPVGFERPDGSRGELKLAKLRPFRVWEWEDLGKQELAAVHQDYAARRTAQDSLSPDSYIKARIQEGADYQGLYEREHYKVGHTLETAYHEASGHYRWNRSWAEAWAYSSKQFENLGLPVWAQEGLQCVACYDNKKTFACVPCGHLCLCQSCKGSLRDRRCPVCRSRIDTMFRIFS